MAYEKVVGLEVTDETVYEDYRKEMAPLLKKHHGSFRFDFKVSDVLTAETTTKTYNRVFVISFKDKKHADAFYEDLEYRIVKQSFFDKTVKARTVIAEYAR